LTFFICPTSSLAEAWSPKRTSVYVDVKEVIETLSEHKYITEKFL